MKPKNIKLGSGELYFHTPEGLRPLGSVTEATAIEVEETEWADDYRTVIKTDQEATFTAEVKITPDMQEAFRVLGETCKQAAEALEKVVRAAIGCTVTLTGGLNITKLLEIAKVKAALEEAPPKVRHLAQHGKKYRTRKKNINRALREYERRQANEHDIGQRNPPRV